MGCPACRSKKKRLEYQKLDKVIRENIPAGFEVRKQLYHLAEEMAEKLGQLHCHKHININIEKTLASLGTLGGGNHFIEVDKSENGDLYVVVHSGSRHLGKEVTDFYVEAGAKRLKEQGLAVPYPLTWLEGDLMEQYLADVKIAQEYAAWNREIILAEIKKGMKIKEKDFFSSIHNHMDDNEGMRILRKGAISAKEGERVIIPVNMRDGVILGIGKGNPNWNCSAPHGSGRKIRRDEVKNQYTVSSFKKKMKGIHCTCMGADTLDEAPFAYRSIQQLMEKLEGTVLWICKSSIRPEHKRKNWYVDVSIIPEKEMVEDSVDYRIEKFHCGGKGGQNVNKVESGVRVIHIPTGIIVTSTEERSQYLNKQKALKRLAAVLVAMKQEASVKQTNQAWREHTKIVRGNPVRTYEGEKFRMKENLCFNPII